MPAPVVDVESVPRALRAKEAGEYLARLVGLPKPIPATTMWRFARLRRIKTIRCGRLHYFRTTELEQFVSDSLYDAPCTREGR